MLSRVADSLYWMGRYLERTEGTARLLDEHLTLMLDIVPASAPMRWRRFLSSLCLDEVDRPGYDARDITREFTTDEENSASIRSCIAAARENARQVRDTLGAEMFEQLNRAYFFIREASFDAIWDEGPTEFLRRIRESACLFHGITDSTFSRNEGYHFIRLGCYIERALMTVALIDSYREFYSDSEEAASPTPEEHLDWITLLKCCTAFDSYRRRYTAEVKENCVLEFLLLDPDFPHSVRFCIDRIAEGLEIVGQNAPHRDRTSATRIAARLQADLTYGSIEEILAENFANHLSTLRQRCELIHEKVNAIFIEYPIERELARPSLGESGEFRMPSGDTLIRPMA